jgi:hypothetical protein
MSPFRRRKRGSRAGSRRRQLVERERLRYERERSGAQPEPEAEGVESPPERAESPPEEQKKPLLPETARRAREKRSRPRRRRISKPSAPRLEGLRSASRSGARATVRQTAPGARRLIGGIAGLLGRLAALLLRIAGLAERAVLTIVDAVTGIGGRALGFAERQLTPERVLVAVIAAAGGLLVYSQFVAYRGVEVGQPQYSEVSTVAPAPQTDRIDAGAAHAYVLIPLAAIAVAIALLALLSGRWRLGRLVSLIGLLGIAISLAIDLPKGLDAGTAGTAFAGAKATMTEGFYAQLAASAVLVLCGWVLSVDLRLRAGVPAGKRRFRRPWARQRRAPSVAGGGA